ncbi:MAG: hypothetical protein NXI04_18250 [Planctomycetaceae bacterium]|nr:hypothetical protein [Planctomycetaceae bacterium]
MSFFGVFFSAVPKLFWSEYSGEPFRQCIACKVPLLEANMHVVKKKIVGNEAVLEMALCNRCQQQQMEEMSEETRKNLTAFMSEQFQKMTAEQLSGDEDGPRVIEVVEVTDEQEGQDLLQRCTDNCIVCGIDRDSCHRYSLAGVCQDSQLVVQVTPLGQTPMMVCEKCEEKMNDLISQETRDSWDRFVEEHLDGPPGVELDSPSTFPMSP